jgi:predicted permease
VAFAAAGIRVLQASATVGVPRLEEAALDLRVLLFAISTSLLASILFGTGPAWRLSSGEGPDALRRGGGATGAVSARRMRHVLVVSECALAVILLAGAGLLIRSLALVQSVRPGFDANRVLVVRVNLPLPMSPQWRTQEWATFQEIEARLAAVPGVSRVGMIQDFLRTANPEETITIDGSPGAVGNVLLPVTDTTPGFFEAAGVPLLRGRFFTAQEQNAMVAIVNDSFARRFLPGQDAVGRRFKEGGPDAKGAWRTIVGVVGDMHREGPERDPRPEYFLCSTEPTMDIAVRTTADPSTVAPAAREAIRAVYGEAVVLRSASIAETLGDLTAPRRFQTWLLGMFAVVALALAAIGTYGVVHFAVAHRRQEIGIRMALGARGGDVARLILAQGMALPIAGTAVGLIGALALTRVIRHLLFRVGPGDPVTFGAVATLLIVVAATACWLPARRAMRVDPLVAIRHE